MKVPDAGDLITIDFDPQAGREIMKRRPALVLSPKAFNERLGFAWICPVSSVPSKHGFQLAIPKGIRGFDYASAPGASTVKIEQLRSLDFNARNAQIIAKVPSSFLAQCCSIARRVLETH